MRLTAKQLGDRVGLDSKEVNLRLAELEYLDGKPGAWSITEKGRQHGEERYNSNGYGSYAAKSWRYFVWDEDAANQIGDPIAHKKEVNRNRKLIGLPPIKSRDK